MLSRGEVNNSLNSARIIPDRLKPFFWSVPTMRINKKTKPKLNLAKGITTKKKYSLKVYIFIEKISFNIS